MEGPNKAAILYVCAMRGSRFPSSGWPRSQVGRGWSCCTQHWVLSVAWPGAALQNYCWGGLCGVFGF